jgi:hypothetical protein
MRKWAARLGLAAVGVLAASVVGVGTAYAHVDVEADPAMGGATNALVSFDAEAESPSAGIESVRVVLPTGIAPADVSLADGPSGWSLAPTDDGYTVSGDPLARGENAVYSIRVARLPDAAELVFKTLVTYTDDSVDRWIGGANDDNPAPVLKLTPNPKPAPTTPPAANSEPATTPAPAPAPTTDVVAEPADEGGSGWRWLLIGLLVLAGAGGAVLYLRQRRAAE